MVVVVVVVVIIIMVVVVVLEIVIVKVVVYRVQIKDNQVEFTILALSMLIVTRASFAGAVLAAMRSSTSLQMTRCRSSLNRWMLAI